jgi:hypothetical protein
MLNSNRKFGFPQGYEELFPDSSDTIASAILKDAVHCPDEDTCFKWATVYHNISIILDDSFTEYYREFGNWKYENTRPLLCQLEYAVVRNSGFVFLVSNGSHLLELINDVIFRVVEGGIFMQIKKRGFDIQKIEPKFNSLNYDHTYITINIRHLQTAFYLLMLGHVLAVVCFLTEIMWHR